MEIECKFGFAFGGYHCKVTEASITKPNVDIVSFKGNHQPGKNNNDVTIIQFENAKIEYFPRNLQRIFPKLKSLVIQSCGLIEISREDLVGLEKLVSLQLTHNQIKLLPDDLFGNMPNLKQVWLNDNKIEFASSKLIEPIVHNQLERFYLRNNTSINEYYNGNENPGSWCKTIQELMAKIDKNCKPQKPQLISRAVKRKSNCCESAEIFKSFNELRLRGRFTDFIIVVASKEFPVNKNVLAAQSSVLAEMFEVKTNGRLASKLEISDLSAEAVEAFLDYLYDHKKPDQQNVVEIFKLAVKYKVEKLTAICEEIILDSLDESNAFEIFKLAGGAHNSEVLKIAAFRKLQEKYGSDLGENLLNHPEKIQKIVELRRQIDALTQEDRE